MNVFPATYRGEIFQVSGQLLPCPTALQAQLQLGEGQTIDLGIRPEQIEIKNALNDTQEGEKISQLIIEVNVVEPLGREILVRGSLPASDVVLNVHASSDWRGHPGDRIGVQLDLDQLFVFDPRSGDTLYP
jgi:multiple sugar transport system ATP-binding protein